MKWTSILPALLAGVLHAAPDSPPETALQDYVAAADETFIWRLQASYEAPGAEVALLRLRSQTWRGTLWKHRLYVIRPEGIEAGTRRGLLVLAGGRWREGDEARAPAELPEDAALFIGMARRLGTPIAVLTQVPFQPLFQRTEDELIAHTFDEYLASGDAEWPLLLPMVKSAVRAMDAVQAFAASEWRMTLERFTVLGGSKRGWTAWLAGAVEPRAAALVPVVIDALNFETHLPYQRELWGAPSPQLEPYTRRGLDEALGSERGRRLREIVDPYSYRERFTQPKLIAVATNDPYFPVDALNLYWEDLPDPKHLLYLPNDVHSIQDYGRLTAALGALDDALGEGPPLPELAWEYRSVPGALRLCVRADREPAAVLAWSAASEDGDFRDAEFSSAPLRRGENGAYVLELAHPARGFKAVFAEAWFGTGPDRYALSTNLRLTGADGRPPREITAIRGRPGVCP